MACNRAQRQVTERHPFDLPADPGSQIAIGVHVAMLCPKRHQVWCYHLYCPMGKQQMDDCDCGPSHTDNTCDRNVALQKDFLGHLSGKYKAFI